MPDGPLLDRGGLAFEHRRVHRPGKEVHVPLLLPIVIRPDVPHAPLPLFADDVVEVSLVPKLAVLNPHERRVGGLDLGSRKGEMPDIRHLAEGPRRGSNSTVHLLPGLVTTQ
jgi:hypothetical protein